ncbi:transmembrane protein, putative (macronuclear) [Tetrahymena thermophila SB210]|uniref:Transmembrane protein, putative n=1 Tax=Tetrahymena thermophila (strain SB210) TaxID=312017 RepID=W7X2A3_TETTS|nr:transmembrane protein, putative [Tetrahymena thermophila SB210]EWS71767.1 transmembrane protein, putative [Tetrahymena thermophila SB210]|eukprot:XP_012655698.1 transmembrane protein, putative [Tetrahymena thermophila SB210]
MFQQLNIKGFFIFQYFEKVFLTQNILDFIIVFYYKYHSYLFLQVNKLYVKIKKQNLVKQINSSQTDLPVPSKTIKQFKTFSVILYLFKLYKFEAFTCQLYLNLKYYPSIIFLSFFYLP